MILTNNTSSSRPLIPYSAQINDSGFSSFSSCSYLPPPPPYRQRSIIGNGGSTSLDATSTLKNDNNSTNIFNEIANNYTESENLKNNNNIRNHLNVFSNFKSSHRIHRSLSDSKYKSNLIIKQNYDNSNLSRKTSTGSSLSVHSAFESAHRLQRSFTHGNSSDCVLSKQVTPSSVLITNEGFLPNPYLLKAQGLEYSSNLQEISNEDIILNKNNINSLSAETTNTPSIVLTRVKKNNRNRSSSIWTCGSQISLVS